MLGRTKQMAIGVYAMCALIIVGCVLAGILLHKQGDGENTVEIRFEEESAAEVVEFHELTLNPGDSEVYSLMLTNQLSGDCSLTVDFSPADDHPSSNSMAQYVYAKVELNGETVYEMRLSELLRTEAKTLECRMDTKKPIELRITYHMPEDVGNEAENTEAWFDLALTTTRN